MIKLSQTTVRPVRCGWCFPRTAKHFGSELMQQQLWCWGRDIEYPQENLLMRFGFQRYRDEVHSQPRSTCYRLDQDQMHIAMWGFGVFFGQLEHGGIFVGRFDFAPEWAGIESLSLGIHWIGDLPAFSRPRGREQWSHAHQLWNQFLAWVEDYERWVLETIGREYRDQCVASWLRPLIAAEQIPTAWQSIRLRSWENQPGSWLKKFRPPDV